MAKVEGTAGRELAQVRAGPPMNMSGARTEAKRRFGPTAMVTTSRYLIKPDGTRKKLVGVMSTGGSGGNWLGQGWTWEDAFASAERQIARNIELIGRRW